MGKAFQCDLCQELKPRYPQSIIDLPGEKVVLSFRFDHYERGEREYCKACLGQMLLLAVGRINAVD